MSLTKLSYNPLLSARSSIRGWWGFIISSFDQVAVPLNQWSSTPSIDSGSEWARNDSVFHYLCTSSTPQAQHAFIHSTKILITLIRPIRWLCLFELHLVKLNIGTINFLHVEHLSLWLLVFLFHSICQHFQHLSAVTARQNYQGKQRSEWIKMWAVEPKPFAERWVEVSGWGLLVPAFPLLCFLLTAKNKSVFFPLPVWFAVIFLLSIFGLTLVFLPLLFRLSLVSPLLGCLLHLRLYLSPSLPPSLRLSLSPFLYVSLPVRSILPPSSSPFSPSYVHRNLVLFPSILYSYFLFAQVIPLLCLFGSNVSSLAAWLDGHLHLRTTYTQVPNPPFTSGPAVSLLIMPNLLLYSFGCNLSQQHKPKPSLYNLITHTHTQACTGQGLTSSLSTLHAWVRGCFCMWWCNVDDGVFTTTCMCDCRLLQVSASLDRLDWGSVGVCVVTVVSGYFLIGLSKRCGS